MTRRFATTFAIILAAAATGARPSAEGAHTPLPSVEIVVDGAATRQYPHQGRLYVEAVKGREYAIRMRNPYPVRVAVALSVDGLNTIDARESSASDARKWVLDAYETVTISGWQVSQSHARRFEFTTEERSYGAALGKTANLGVISAVFFRERAPMVLTDKRREGGRARPDSDAAGEPQPAPSAAGAARKNEEYAATGMGQSTGHAVTQVHIDLEASPAATVNIRYEFRPQLVRLGILPTPQTTDPLTRREGARGFSPGFCPEPIGRR